MTITLVDRAMLLFYYCIPKEHCPFDLNDSQYGRALERLIQAGFVDLNNGLQVTEAGKVFCEALRNVPFPEQRWIIPAKPEAEPKHV